MAFERGLKFVAMASVCLWGSSAFAARIISAPVSKTRTAVGQLASARFSLANPGDDYLIIAAVTPDDPACKVNFTRTRIIKGTAATAVLSCPISEVGIFTRSATVHFIQSKAPTQFTERVQIAGEGIEECGADVDLTQAGGAMEPVIEALPIVQQTGGSCTFHTATQLFDAWRARNAPGVKLIPSSPLELNYRMQASHGSKDLSGGFLDENLKELAKNGACPRAFYDPKTGKDLDEKFYNDLYILFNRYLKDSKMKSFEIASKLMASIKKARFYDVNPHPDYQVLSEAIDDADFIRFVREASPPTCSEKEELHPKKPFSIVFHSFNAHLWGMNWHNSYPIKADIEEELNKGLKNAYPIGISYCSSVLDEGRSFEEIKSIEDEKCGAHASVVVGRRREQKSGKCQFLIRNSWGASKCDKNKDWECVPEKGLVWVDSGSLSNAIYGTTHIE